ncbi:MAG: ferritin-like domain-containing protein [Alphaproteobacteria bacterium]|nr:ferritin-like domain-containing protein [Alphaproteobacteria bacterium]
MTTTQSAQEIFADGLRNAHAMEKQALSMIQPQLNRLEHYPEVSEMLERHYRETEVQIQRLDEILASMDTSASALKDLGLSISGSMAAMGHTIAGDEILKNSFANFAFENFEIASYTSLITVAELCGATSAVPLLQQNLEEEQRMATMLQDSLPLITRKFVSLSGSDNVRADI